MKTTLLIFGAICLIAGDALAGSMKSTPNYRSVVTFGGGNGSSHETAIIVHATDQISGFSSVFVYIKGHFPDYPYVIKEQREHRNNKAYDVLTLASYNWKRRIVYFDISAFVKKK